jgi:Tfp pilus assembly protein FimT
MVVIALIGILSAMIIPEMRGTLEEALLRATSRQLVNVCNLAYSRAVSKQQMYRITLDPSTGKFMLEKRQSRTVDGKNFVPAEDVSGSQGTLDTRISVRFSPSEVQDNGSPETMIPTGSDEGGRIAIGFYPDGTADAGEIQLRDRQGFGLLLRISPVTSRVRVSELPRE